MNSRAALSTSTGDTLSQRRGTAEEAWKNVSPVMLTATRETDGIKSLSQLMIVCGGEPMPKSYAVSESVEILEYRDSCQFCVVRTCLHGLYFSA